MIRITFITLTLMHSIILFSQEKENKINPFNFSGSYVGDCLGNMYGGLNNGAAFLGMANISLSFSTQEANWWNGGVLYINGCNTHRISPNYELFGDFQTLCNIDADETTFFHELWYSQKINNFEFIIGVQDLNKNFASSNNGSLFINSSFGIPSVISDNIPAPIFPCTRFGFSMVWNINNEISWLGSAYDVSDGILSITEVQFKTNFFNYLGEYKVGTYAFNSHEYPKKISNYGIYAIADQTLWKESEEKRIEMFTQVSISPKRINEHYLYLGGGINFYGLIENRANDSFGLAIANARLSELNNSNRIYRNETAIELYYNYNITENISIQPDLQYIISPCGSEDVLENCFAGILRMKIEF